MSKLYLELVTAVHRSQLICVHTGMHSLRKMDSHSNCSALVRQTKRFEQMFTHIERARGLCYTLLSLEQSVCVWQRRPSHRRDDARLSETMETKLRWRGASRISILVCFSLDCPDSQVQFLRSGDSEAEAPLK